MLLLWLLFGVASAIVANGKGRDGCGWFILGVLLGPFGLILALVVSSDNEELAKKKLQSGQMKKCPFCAELVQREAVKCRYCGSDLTATQHDAPTQKQINSPPKQYTPEERAKLDRQNKVVLYILYGFMVFGFAFAITAKFFF